MTDRTHLNERVRDHPVIARLLPYLDGRVSVVGGLVRDALLGREHLHDVDLVVEGDAIALARHVAARLGAPVTSHGRFGTAVIELPHGAGHVDVITARREGVTAAPIQAVVVRQVDKDGKVVDPAIGQTGPGDAANTPTRTAKLEEKEGVFVVQAGKAVFKTVKTGIVGDTDIEITEGVKDGDEIVIGSYRTLRTLRNEAQLKFEDQSKNKAAK